MSAIDTANKDAENSDYKVGYKKPPKEHCFKPGQSGNPGGRPKKDQAIRTLEDAVDDAASLVAKAVKNADPSDATAFKAALEVLDRVLGKANQSVKIDAKLDHGSESVSATSGWIEETIRARADSEAKKSRTH